MAILVPTFELGEKIGHRVEIEAGTVDELIAKATARFGETFAQSTRYAVVVVNGQGINYLKGGRTPLGARDEVWFLRPSAGG
jgi:molybdopterin converting factor small subunit